MAISVYVFQRQIAFEFIDVFADGDSDGKWLPEIAGLPVTPCALVSILHWLDGNGEYCFVRTVRRSWLLENYKIFQIIIIAIIIIIIIIIIYVNTYNICAFVPVKLSVSTDRPPFCFLLEPRFPHEPFERSTVNRTY